MKRQDACIIVHIKEDPWNSDFSLYEPILGYVWLRHTPALRKLIT